MHRALLAVALGLAVGGVAAHDPVGTKVSWDREIGPLVQARCVSCHSPGGRAPMPLTTYEEARPWARAIREEVLTRRMPKWHVVRGYGDFSNDPSLSPFEIALFAAWADGGAPRSLPKSPAAPPIPFPRPESDGRATFRHGAPVERSTRTVDVPCSARTLPRGVVVGLKPLLQPGDDLRMTVTHADGTQEPLLWLRQFDPAFAPTYWLRLPVQVTGRTRVTMASAAPCKVSVLLEARRGR